MVYYGYRRKRSARRPKRRVRAKRTGLGVKAVKRIAQQVADSGRETKMVNYIVDDFRLASYNIGTFGGSANSLTRLCCTPNTYTNTPATQLSIPSGTGSDERIGNKIEMTGGKIRIMFNAAQQDTIYNPAPQPQIVQVYVGYDKTQAHGIPLANFPDFYMNRDTAVAPTGTLIDTFRTVNTSRYVICYKRTVKIGMANYQGSNNNPAFNYWANNDFKYSARVNIDFTKRMIKSVKYSDQGETIPTGRQLWCWFMVVNPYGAVGVGRPIKVNAECINTYQDA